MRAIFPTAALALALTAACSATPAAAPTPVAPPADGGSYTSPRDIVAKITAAGITCSDYAPIAHATGAHDRGSCRDGDLVVSTYDSEGDVQAQVEFQESLGVGVSLLSGRNWTLNFSDRAVLEKARSVLGGKIVFEVKP